MSGIVGERGRCRRRRVGEPRLDVAHGVVAEHPGKAAAEARQSRRRRRAITAQERGDERERIAFVALDDRSVVFYFDRRAARADALSCRQTDERVTAEALAADDGLEEERVRLVGELHVQRQRRVEVRERLEDERNAVMALRGEGAEFAFGHDASTIVFDTGGNIGGSLGARHRRDRPTEVQARQRRQAVAHHRRGGRRRYCGRRDRGSRRFQACCAAV